MPGFYPHFTVFVVDARDIQKVKPVIERGFGCVFQPLRADRPADEIKDHFETSVFGLRIHLAPVAQRAEGFVYRLVGGNEAAFTSQSMERVSIAAHVVRVLRRSSFTASSRARSSSSSTATIPRRLLPFA